MLRISLNKEHKRNIETIQIRNLILDPRKNACGHFLGILSNCISWTTPSIH